MNGWERLSGSSFSHLHLKPESREWCTIDVALKGAVWVSWETRSQHQGKGSRDGDSRACFWQLQGHAPIKLCRDTELHHMTFIYGMSVCSCLGSRCHDSKWSFTAPLFQIAGNLEKNVRTLTSSHRLLTETSTVFGLAPSIGEISFFHS